MSDSSALPRTAPSSLPAELAPTWLQLSHDLIVVTDRSGTIIWANTDFCASTGLGAQGGADLRRLLPVGPSGQAGQEVVHAALQGKALWDEELEWQTIAGGPLWVRARTMASPGGIVWVLQDITQAVNDRRQAERQTELLDMAQEYGRLGIWERNIPSGDGRWDRHVFGFWGLDPSGETPSFEHAATQVHPDDQASMRAYRESTRTAGHYAQRYRVLRPDGSTRWIHAQWKVKSGVAGEPDRALGVVMDDTEAFELARSLGHANEQLKLAADLADIVTFRHDFETGRLHYSDRGFAVLDMPPRAGGVPAAEVRALLHPDDLPVVLASAQETMRTGGPTDVEARYKRSDGTWRYIMTRRVLQRSAAGEPVAFLGVALDVTEQVERTRQAGELSRRLNAAAQAARVGIWTTTPSTEVPEWNEQMFELFDMDKNAPAPSLRRWVDTCVHPDDRERVLKEAKAYLRQGDSPAEFELRTIRRDGSSRWIVLRADLDRSNPGRRRLLGVALDVTEHHEALAALRSVDQRAALAARSAGIGTWEVDVITGTESWDEQMFALRDLPVRAKPPSREERMAMLHPDDAHLVLDSQRNAISADESSQYEFRIRLPGGGLRWLASRSIPVRNAHGAAVRRVGVNWDITESKNAQVALQEKAIAERESQAKSQFLSRMSHELRTPLNAVLGFTQLLQRDSVGVLGREQKIQLGHIRTAGEHLLSLINDALELSSLETGNLKLEPQAIDLGAIVAQALPLVESLARDSQVQLRFDRSAGGRPAMAWADPTRVRQVLLNLLSNAVKYNRSQGEVTVSVRSREGAALVRVTDTGRGMTPEQISHLFEPFNRLGIESEGIEGTGIGLVIVKALVEGMGGTLGVTSQAGRGTAFELSLPQPAPGPTTAAALLEDATALTLVAPLERQGQILYIEDNDVNVLLVRELVGTLPGMSLVAETTGQAGVDRTASLLPDLVLVDMQLPDFDGFEVLRRLRNQPTTAHIPCIALSANAMPEDIARALGAGFEDYWTKPIAFKPFIAALERRFPLQPPAPVAPVR
jgi:PAS domain S-box-containing protein